MLFLFNFFVNFINHQENFVKNPFGQLFSFYRLFYLGMLALSDRKKSKDNFYLMSKNNKIILLIKTMS